MIISYIYINNVKFTPLTVNLHPNCLADSLTWLKKIERWRKKRGSEDIAVSRDFPLDKRKGCSKVLTESSINTKTSQYTFADIWQ